MAADATAPAPDRRLVWASLAALALGVAVIYRPALHGPLLLDDHASIEHNASLQHWRTALFPPPAAGVGGRPLLNLTFALNAHVGGYHVTNLAIHLLAAWTLFALVGRTLPLTVSADGPRRARAPFVAAFFAAALWAVHPLATESVSYLAQRAESLMALWYLLTLLCYARGRHAAAGLCCLAGMLTKETMVTAPLAVLLYDRCFLAGGFAAAWRVRRKPLLALAATWIPLGWIARGLAQRQVGFAAGMPWWRYARAECFAVVRYLRLALWPHPLIFDYGPQADLAAAGLWCRVAVLVAFGAAIAALWRRRPGAAFCLLGVLLVLAPTSTVIPIASQPVAESRMYLPLAALAALAASAIGCRFGRRGAFGLALAAVLLGWAAERRNRAYGDAAGLWRDTVAKAPGNSRAHENLGYVLQERGDLAGAAAAYRRALALNPRSAEAHSNLGSVLERQRQPAAALAEFDAALRIEPGFAAARANVAILREDWGKALAARGQFAAAADQFSASIAADPERASAHYDLGNALKRLPGRAAAAADEYEAALRLAPGWAEAHNNYANLLLAEGRTREAIAHYREALRLKPDFAGARLNLQRAEAAP